MARMTPAEKVGQLVLVAFYGSNPDPLTDVEALIQDQHVGGVVLQRTNNVFSNRDNPDLPAEIAALTGALQRKALANGGIPLLIAVDHEGDAMAHLRSGFTPLPNPMAIGATWDPEVARRVGEIAGRELSAVGVNMLLGPVLDVLALPRSDSQGDLGTRVFGGDPYWVGELGRSYIEGVHEGSEGRVLTIGKHFPGHGNSDRLPDQEVAVVSQGVEDLKKIELPPFAAVTAGEPAANAVADGLMTSHIQYRGLQGNLRSITRPLSFDGEGLKLLLGLPGEPFAAWRQRGGLLVSDSLGVKAVRRYFDPSDQTFPHREVARSALMAGNDVLTLAEFSQRQAWSVMRRNVSDTLAYLASSYDSDSNLRARVDDALQRVLAAKHRLYPEPAAAVVEASTDPGSLAQSVGRSQDGIWLDTAMQTGVTALRSYARPQAGDRLVVVTDSGRQLACPPGEQCGLSSSALGQLNALGPTLVEGFLLARYGASGSAIIRREDVHSLSFCQLRELLSPEATLVESTADPLALVTPDLAPGRPTTSPSTACVPLADPAGTREALEAADWVIFAFADLRHDEAQLLNGFLLPEVARLVGRRSDAHLAALAFGPPYLIDRTNVERLDAFLAGYSRIAPAIQATVAALFGDPKPVGASPVSVEDAGYDLAKALEPAADQTLAIDAVTDLGTLSRLPATIEITTTRIVDHNGHPVPDGTVVVVTSDPPGAIEAAAEGREGGPEASTSTLNPTAGAVALTTHRGRAQGRVIVRRSGPLTIHVASPPAHDHEPRVLQVPDLPGAPAVGGGDLAGQSPPVGEVHLMLPQPGAGLDLFDLLSALSVALLASATVVWRAGRRLVPPSGQLVSALGALGGAAGGYLVYALSRPAWPTLAAALAWVHLGPAAALFAALGATAGAVTAARPSRPAHLAGAATGGIERDSPSQ